MPKISDIEGGKPPMHKAGVLLYGLPRTRKSTWVWQTATAHHNVIYMDFEGCSPLSQFLPKDQQDRFYYIDMTRSIRAGHDALIMLWKNQGRLIWDENTQQAYGINATMGDATAEVTYIDLKANPSNSTILVVDGWTKLCHYIAEKRGAVDFTEASLSWNQYNDLFTHAYGLANALCSLPCSVAVITHAERFTKNDDVSARANAKKPQDIAIEFSRIQPVSVSKKHSEQFAGAFSQVLLFDQDRMGNTIIDAKGTKVAMTGGSLLPNKQYQFPQPGFSKMLLSNGIGTETPPPIDNVISSGTLGDIRQSLRKDGSGDAATPTVNLSKFEVKTKTSVK